MGVHENEPQLSGASSPPADSEAVFKPYSFVASYLPPEGLVSHIRGRFDPFVQSTAKACRRGCDDVVQWVRAGGTWRLIVAVTVLVSILVVGASLGTFLLLLSALSLTAIAAAALLSSLAALAFLSCFLTACFVIFCTALSVAGIAIASAAACAVGFVALAGASALIANFWFSLLSTALTFIASQLQRLSSALLPSSPSQATAPAPPLPSPHAAVLAAGVATSTNQASPSSSSLSPSTQLAALLSHCAADGDTATLLRQLAQMQAARVAAACAPAAGSGVDGEVDAGSGNHTGGVATGKLTSLSFDEARSSEQAAGTHSLRAAKETGVLT